MKKVTIIMPVFNVENYVYKAIESVLSQTYKNIELIIIDDCSCDNTRDICNRYKKDNRVKLVLKDKNTGVSESRNIGIRMAKGDYVTFVDGDDYIENNTIEKYIEVVEKNRVDLITSGIYEEMIKKDGKYKILREIKCEEKMYPTVESIRQDFVKLWDKHILYNIANKFYNMEIIKKYKITFPSIDFGEDIRFNWNYLKNIKNMYNINECFYHYIRERTGSATTIHRNNLFELRKKEYVDFASFFKEFGINEEDSKEFLSRRHLDRIIGCIEGFFYEENDIISKKNKIKDILNDEYTIEAAKYAMPRTKKTKILYKVIKNRNGNLTYIIGYIIYIIRKKFKGFFLILKNSR